MQVTLFRFKIHYNGEQWGGPHKVGAQHHILSRSGSNTCKEESMGSFTPLDMRLVSS